MLFLFWDANPCKLFLAVADICAVGKIQGLNHCPVPGLLVL